MWAKMSKMWERAHKGRKVDSMDVAKEEDKQVVDLFKLLFIYIIYEYVWNEQIPFKIYYAIFK